MNILWPSFRRAETAGDISLFRRIQPQFTQLAKQMYGEKNVGAVRYGRVGGTACKQHPVFFIPLLSRNISRGIPAALCFWRSGLTGLQNPLRGHPS